MNDMTPRKQRSLTSDKVKTGSPAARIVDKFGGLSRFCEACDFPAATVHSWLTRSGSVPIKRRDGISYHQWIMECAAMHGVKLVAADFLDIDPNG